MNYQNLTTETTKRLIAEKNSIEFCLAQPKSSNWAIIGWSERNVAKSWLDKIRFELAKKYRR